MVTENFLNEAKNGNPVFISDIRKKYDNLESKQTLLCVLELLDGSMREFNINIPIIECKNKEKKEFIESYIYARIYNILSALGGKKMTIYLDFNNTWIKNIADNIGTIFGIDKDRKNRQGYARCINVIDRMLENLSESEKEQKFIFDIKKLINKPNIECKEESLNESAVEMFRNSTKGLEGKTICGMDIGGTDIKIAVAVDGKIACFKEYDWFPASFTNINQLMDPVVLLVRLIRAKLSFDLNDSAKERENISKLLDLAMKKDAGNDIIIEAVEKAEDILKADNILLDAIGLCFPDVVVKDKIVGGEVYKTRGIRNNPKIDYEEEFRKLIHLDNKLQSQCKPDGVVRITNDGPMASFTAAVETAYTYRADDVKNGVFAHTLGTELGTGWVDEKGEIPEIPLEVYNFIIDLGSFPEKEYVSDDLRSINNFNTELAGTLQKYASQSGVFRLALKYFKDERKDLYDEMFKKGFVVEKEVNGVKGLYVPTEPVDLRKPFLQYLMDLTSTENCEVCNRIFKDIGKFLAVTWLETESILKPKAKSRVLFGRLVKNKFCFELMQQGAKEIQKDIKFDIADGTMANTELMKILDEDPNYTVAQFAQAVGAIYFGNTGLIKNL